jgi:flagellin
MAFRINHNIASLNSYRNLAVNDRGLSQSLERLSSGLRINKSADDPAGLVVSQNMRAQIAGLGQAIENSEIATSMVQTAEGALTEVHSLLTSMRELAIHAANEGANSSADLAADQAEIANALSTIDRIAANTQFGSKKLLDGSNGVQGSSSETDLSFLSGTSATTANAYTVTVTAQAEKATFTGTSSAAITGIAADEVLTLVNDDSGVSVTINLVAGDDQQTIIDKINAYSDSTQVVASATANPIVLTSSVYGTAGDFTITSDTEAFDGTQSGFDTDGLDTDDGVNIAGNFDVGGTNYQADGAGDILTGRAGSVAEGLRVQTAHAAGDAGVVTVTNNALVFQIGANAGQSVNLSIGSVAGADVGKGLDSSYGGTNQFATLGAINIETAAKATDALAVIDKAISDISTLRGTLGAFQSNTLESGMNNMRVAEENLVAAESLIRDTDMAAEMATFTRNQIMLQAATSMLAQANSAPQTILSLLR